MIVDHGYKTCVIESLSYNQTDIRKRMKEERVKELADSIKRTIQMEPIVVNRKTKVVIAGRDRVAANLLLENRTIWCHMVDADAAEVESMERAENLYRRQDDRDALIAAEQEALAKTIAEEEEQKAEALEKAGLPVEDPKGPKKPGRKKTSKGKAREQIAKKLGTSPDAVRKAAERAAKKEKKKSEPKLTGIRADMEKIKEAIMGVVRPLQTGQSGLTKLLAMSAAKMRKNDEPVLQRLKQELHDATARLRLMRPDKVCGYCKGEGIGEDGKDCKGCDFTGYLTEGDAPVPESRAAE